MAHEPNRSDAAAQRAAVVFRRLLATYGGPDWRSRREPVSELIQTILSQNTNDRNADVAFAALLERYDGWQAVLEAPSEELAQTIRFSGLGQQKARHIQAALTRMLDARGEFSLEFLAELPVQQAQEWLTAVPGIGHKTASIVLLFCFGLAAFPVDTHVARVTRRLGLAPAKASPEKIKAIWEGLVDPDQYLELHLGLIRHGREVCRAPRPRCEVCVLNDICQYYQSIGQAH